MLWRLQRPKNKLQPAEDGNASLKAKAESYKTGFTLHATRFTQRPKIQAERPKLQAKSKSHKHLVLLVAFVI
jgi:hypothetical protein